MFGVLAGVAFVASFAAGLMAPELIALVRGEDAR